MGEPVPFGLRIFSTLNSRRSGRRLLRADADRRVAAFAASATSGVGRCIAAGRRVAAHAGSRFLDRCRHRHRRVRGDESEPLAERPVSGPLRPVAGVPHHELTLTARRGCGCRHDLVAHRDAGRRRATTIPHSPVKWKSTTAINQGFANPLGTGLGQVGSSAALSANPERPAATCSTAATSHASSRWAGSGFAGYVFVVFGTLAAMFATLFGAARRTPHLAQLAGRGRDGARNVRCAWRGSMRPATRISVSMVCSSAAWHSAWDCVRARCCRSRRQA